MIIGTAIEQNKQWLKEHPHLGAVNGYKALPPYEAILLGIEALQLIVELRRSPQGLARTLNGFTKVVMPLPSETEEELNANRQQNQ